MIIPFIRSKNTLRLLLYSGIALIVISVLFLGRDVKTASFLGQALVMLAAPAFFYAVGVLVCRYLDAPLAGPGIVATGAWLVGVGLINLYEKRVLLPETWQPYYWFVASMFGVMLITLTGHRVHIWLLVPLVLFAQFNAAWTVMGVLGIDVTWWPACSFLLVLAWWEVRLKEEYWVSVYKVGAIVLAFFLLFFSYWLNAPTPEAVVSTWAAGALTVTLLGLRHGWINAGPLVIVMLAYASAWALPAEAWPLAWVALAAMTIVYIELQAAKSLAVEISVALAVLLAGTAAFFAKASGFFGIAIPPPVTVLALFGSGLSLGWLGWRRGLRIAVHVGLWLAAAAWAEVYFFWFAESGAYGLWLALLAALALLVERIFTSYRRHNGDVDRTLAQAIMRWPLADLSTGLSIIILLWVVFNVFTADLFTISLTLAVVVGVWVASGLIYRLPVLLHVALWVAPLPYALLVLLLVPAARGLPAVGLAWQMLGVVFVLLGHALSKHRTSILLPFFVTGYGLLAVGLTLAMSSELLLPVALGLVVVVCLGTSVAAAFDRHPVWRAMVAWFVSPKERPYAYKNAYNLFLLLGAWLSVIWLYIMLGYTTLSLPRQGIVLVLLSAAWIALGRLLPRIPGVVGWPVYGAGWFMWLIGLVQVFFAPTEALITIVLGLTISVEALYRSHEVYWLPVLILQMLFTALQIAWLLALPGHSVLMAVMVAVGVVGMWYDRPDNRAGRLTALTVGLLALFSWLVYRDLVMTLGLGVLLVAAMIRYRRWQWLLSLYGVWAAWLLLSLQLDLRPFWRWLLLAGLVQLAIGSALLKWHRPRRHRSFWHVVLLEYGWASPFLWVGGLSVGYGTVMGFYRAPVMGDATGLVFFLTVATAAGALWLGLRQAPYLPVGFGLFTIIQSLVQAMWLAGAHTGDVMLAFSTVMASSAALLQVACRYAIRQPSSVPRRLVWWIRPLLGAGYFLALVSGCIMLILFADFYVVQPAGLAVNGAALTEFAMIVLFHQRRLKWLWLSIGLSWVTWALILNALALSGVLWHTIPLAVVMLILARVWDQARILEYGSVAVIVAGGAVDVYRFGLMSHASLVLGVQLFGLILYGCNQRRRVPFAGAAAAIAVWLAMYLLRLNFWLVPLVVGAALMSAALLLEVRRDVAERWVSGWLARWAGWR